MMLDPPLYAESGNTSVFTHGMLRDDSTDDPFDDDFFPIRIDSEGNEHLDLVFRNFDGDLLDNLLFE